MDEHDERSGPDSGPRDSGPRASNSGTTSALVLGAGLLLGLAADGLLREGPLGPGFTIWMALLGGTAIVLARRERWRWRPIAGWAVVAVMAIAGTMWRASPVLWLLYFATALVAASGAILAARGRRLGETSVLDHVWGLLLVPWHAVTGTVALLTRAAPPARWGSRRAAAVGRGVLLAIPPVLIFGALFASADPAFERAAGTLIPDIEQLPAHLFLVGFFGWVGAGLLGGLFPARGDNPLEAARPPRLGTEEIATVLGLVAVVFVAFLAIQFSYLFGGASAIENVSGLTVAEYARRGFFELVAVTGLVTVLLLVGHAVTDDAQRPTFRLLAGLLVALVVPVIVSAGLRLRLYVTEFGLTDDRLFAAAIMAWIAITLALFAATVLRDRPRPFASGALVAGLVTVAALTLLNPDALVARTNVARARTAEAPAVRETADGRLETSSNAPGTTRLDGGYLASLSADAVPVILPAVLDESIAMTPDDRCALAGSLLRRWGPESIGGEEADWRRWNAARARAWELVGGAVPELEATARVCD